MVKSNVIQVRFSDENVIGITAKTRLLGMSISGWIRMLVLRELNDVVSSDIIIDDGSGLTVGELDKSLELASEVIKASKHNGKDVFYEGDRSYTILESNGKKFKNWIDE